MSKQEKCTPMPWVVKHLRDKGINARGKHYEILHPLINETGEYAGKIGGYHTVVGDKNCQPGYILSKADANLIAAAPDLLAALKMLRDAAYKAAIVDNYAPFTPEELATVNAAISKAEE